MRLQLLAGRVGQALRPTNDRVSQLQKGRLCWRQYRRVSVLNAIGLFLVQPCRTGRVKANALSVTAIGYARIA